jgi:MerR family transcriptional regulator, light-induced transcriptional regulator
MTDGSGVQPDYGIGALARRLGIAPATLRDWERRYGIGPGGRTAGGHRRYRPDDIARIERMRRLILDGVPPGEAARAALSAEPGPEFTPQAAGIAPEVAGAASAAGPELAGAGRAVRGAGGRSLPLPGRLPQARGLARAALALDAPAMAGALGRYLTERGVVATWEDLAVPVLAAIGERNAATGSCVDAEHLLSAQLLTALAVRARPREARNSRTILLACADDAQHSLPLYALAAALAERHVETRLLGPRTPPQALADAVSRTGPAAVFVWSQTAATGDPAQVAGLPRQRPPLRLFLAGPGWAGVPSGTRTVLTLPEAVQEACAAVGAA